MAASKDELCDAASAALTSGAWEEACDAATQCIDLAPDHVSAYRLRGAASFSLKRWAAARADLDRAVALDPSDAGTLWRAALAATMEAGLVLPDMISDRQRELYLGARAHMKRALDLHPRDARLWARLSNVEHTLGDRAAASAANQRALELDPDDPTALRSAAIEAAKQGRQADALAAYSRLIEKDPGDDHAHERRANIHEQSGDLEAALADYEAVLINKPNDPVAVRKQPELLMRLGRLDEALAAYDALCNRPDQEDHELFQARAALNERLGRTDQAAADRKRADELEHAWKNGRLEQRWNAIFAKRGS
jgi:tetratricopeptide (TPR) repeat protein